MKCCISGCDNEMQCPSTGTCKNCYQNLLTWSKRPAKDIIKRSQKLGLYNSRMQTIAPSQVKILNPGESHLSGMPGKIKIKLKKKRKIITKKRLAS